MSNSIKVTIRNAEMFHPLRFPVRGDSPASARENVKVVHWNYVESSPHAPSLDKTPLFPQAVVHIFRSNPPSSCPELTKCRRHYLSMDSTHCSYPSDGSWLLTIQVMALNPES